VSHGSDRVQPARPGSHRTDRARVPSMPSTGVGAGSGSHRAAAVTSARCAVCQATPYSAATSDTARFDRATATPSDRRGRSVSRDRGPIPSLRSTNDPRPQAASAQRLASRTPQSRGA
jgi:hypothetical protein